MEIKKKEVQHYFDFPNLNIVLQFLVISFGGISYKVFISFSNTEGLVTFFKRSISRTFFCIWISRIFTIHITGGEGGGYPFTLLYYFHTLDKHLGISRENAAESSLLHIASSRARTANLCFSKASC